MKPGLPLALPATRPKRGGDAAAIVVFGTISTLYFAREILIPFAFALILTFLLTPVVTLLQRLRTGRVLAVLITVLLSIVVVGGIGWIIANQLVEVASQLPLYRENINAKIEAFHIPVTGQVGQTAASVQEIARELTGPGEASTAPRSILAPG
jgi:predicted PurR-regulated permease PerM